MGRGKHISVLRSFWPKQHDSLEPTLTDLTVLIDFLPSRIFNTFVMVVLANPVLLVKVFVQIPSTHLLSVFSVGSHKEGTD